MLGIGVVDDPESAGALDTACEDVWEAEPQAEAKTTAAIDAAKRIAFVDVRTSPSPFAIP